MTHYVQFNGIDGEVILVETDDPSASVSGVGRVGIGEVVEKTITKAQNSLADALHVIGKNSQAFLAEVRRLAESPDEFEITFGLKASGEFGTFAIAKANAEANYTVKLKWTKAEKTEPQGTRSLSN